MKNNCLNCSNSVGRDFCTMHKDMNKAQYKKCDGHKILPKKLKPSTKETEERIKYKHIKVLSDDEYLPDFLSYVYKGGFWSFRTGNQAIP